VINRLNLSSKPFRNSTIPWLLSAAILLISIISFVFLYARWGNISSEAQLVKTSSQQIEDELKTYQEKEQQVRQQLTPQQQQVLLAAHKLVIMKQFSWSRLFSDLENVLPGGISVSVVNVDDVVLRNGRTEAELQLGVLSRSYQSVVGMIDNMNSSGIFRAEMRGQDLQRSESGDYSEYTLHLVYTPHYNVSPQQMDTSEQAASNSISEVQQ
jgi:Tfp pilus assembly protein PilN